MIQVKQEGQSAKSKMEAELKERFLKNPVPHKVSKTQGLRVNGQCVSNIFHSAFICRSYKLSWPH